MSLRSHGEEGYLEIASVLSSIQDFYCNFDICQLEWIPKQVNMVAGCRAKLILKSCTGSKCCVNPPQCVTFMAPGGSLLNLNGMNLCFL